MRFVHRSLLPGLIVLLMLVGVVAPSGPAVAQDPECPEGLVYYEPGDICLLPEDVPAGDQPVDPANSPGDDATDDDGETIVDEPEGEPGETGTIRNLTLITFSCPINWNPATRDIEDSREMCTEPTVPDMTYSVLFEGVEQVTVPFGSGVDLAAAGIPLTAGMWTIQESPREGLDAPFAFCAIYAADGSSRLTVAETVPGGSLDILLAAGEEVNCEWYSVATVPEVTGDPNALPIGGLRLDGFSCPYGTSPNSALDYLVATCIEKGVATVEYTASLNGAVVSTQTGATDTPGVDFQSGLDTRLLSGTWTVSAALPAEYDRTSIFCSITTEAGATTDLEPETLFNSVELELQPGDTGFCRWFNIESEPRTGPSLGIVLLLHTCPEGFDPDDGDYQTCTLPLQEPITFDFIRAGQVVETGTAMAPDTQLAVKANNGHPEAGEWTIRPSLQPNKLEPGWACWGVDSAGAKVLDIDYFSPTDGGTGISAKFGPNLMLQCDVWIYAGDLDGTVQVVVYTCPEGFDAANPAAGDRYASCSKTRFVGVEYTVDGATVGQDETDANGLVFTPSQPGQWRIAVTPEEGFGVTFVTCDHTHAALNQVQTIEPTINGDGLSVTLDLDEGDTLRCDFFLGPMPALAETAPESVNAPETGETETGDGDPVVDPGAGENGDGTATDAPSDGETFGGGRAPDDGNVTNDTPAQDPANDDEVADEPGGAAINSLSIQHYDCANPVANVSIDDLVETCTASLEASAWTLNGEPLAVGDGYAEWPDLEPGAVTVTNAATSGKDDTSSAVYCSVATVDGIPLVGVEVPVKDGAIELVLDQSAVIYCAWFVAP